MEEFEPVIVAICCNYCAYAAADLAGSMRLQYPHNIRIIKIPCTGKVDEIYMLKSIESGIDGVIIAGCREGNCHFETGNLRAKKRVKKIKKILDAIGIESERVEMYNLSAGEATRFVEIVNGFTNKIKRLGQNPIKSRGVKNKYPAV